MNFYANLFELFGAHIIKISPKKTMNKKWHLLHYYGCLFHSTWNCSTNDVSFKCSERITNSVCLSVDRSFSKSYQKVLDLQSKSLNIGGSSSSREKWQTFNHIQNNAMGIKYYGGSISINMFNKHSRINKTIHILGYVRMLELVCSFLFYYHFFLFLILFVLLCDFIDRRQSVSQLDNTLTSTHTSTFICTQTHMYNICAFRLYGACHTMPHVYWNRSCSNLVKYIPKLYNNLYGKTSL